MTKIQVNSQGKAYITTGGKALLAQSGSATLITKSITQNGTYNASSDNADGYSSVTVNVSGGVTLTRFKDDNNQEIGTHYMDFTDANGNKYKVIALDAAYMASNQRFSSNTGTITNLPVYADIGSSNVWASKETATFNTQTILDWCTANNYTSQVCTHCRNQSFVIGGTTYYGQLPNMPELAGIAMNMPTLATMDTSTPYDAHASYATTSSRWSSNQNQNNQVWRFSSNSSLFYQRMNSTSAYMVTNPILEIPY